MSKYLLAIAFVFMFVGTGCRATQEPPAEPLPGTQQNSAMLETPALFQISAEELSYTPGVNGYFAHPETPGDYPGVVMIHEWWGLNDHIKEMARKLAGQGYNVLAVDLYRGQVASTREQAQEYRTALKQDEAIVNMKDAAKFLREKNSTKVASFGWCFGGGQSLQLALSGEPLDATVIYYGTLVTSTAQLAAIDAPVLGIFGYQDTSIPVEIVEQFDAALDTLGIQNEIRIYPGVGHAFANPSGMNYAPQETSDAWIRTLKFLQTNLK